MDIVIDFDGTCVTHRYPEIGKEIGATPVLRELVDAGNRLILSTMRSDDRKRRNRTLSDAVEWFRERDIPLFGVQTNPTQQTWTSSPKAYGELYIDDFALGCPLVFPDDGPPYVDWKQVRRMLVEMEILEDNNEQRTDL
ncbi:MAG: hypothetical protein LBR08_05275 [Bacteroidales bacterium]|jgi:hypothetical protein|nr:hypothetical protein [Bacteroidales bacterium]